MKFTVFRELFRSRRTFAAGVLLLAFVVLVAAASLVSPYPPNDSFVVPPDLAPCWPHILGTTSRGQDVFWQLTFAIRNTLLFGFIVAWSAASSRSWWGSFPAMRADSPTAC